MAKIYDPLGLVSPIALGGKFLYRDIGSLQSARQRGVRGVRGTVRGVRGVRGMRGTQKNFKKILKYIKKYTKKNTTKKKLVSMGFEPTTSPSPAKHLIHLSYENT